MTHAIRLATAVPAAALLLAASAPGGAAPGPAAGDGAPAPQVVPNETARAQDSLPVASEPPAEVREALDQEQAEERAGRGTGARGRSTAAPEPEAARLDSLTTEVASQLRCPVCRSQSVLESTASLAREMQSVIREKLAAGQSPDQVKAYFVDKYGSWILLRPEPRGMGLLVYLLPALALLGGGWVVARSLRRWTGTDESAEPAGETSRDFRELRDFSEEERSWLRSELSERNQGSQPL